MIGIGEILNKMYNVVSTTRTNGQRLHCERIIDLKFQRIKYVFE